MEKAKSKPPLWQCPKCGHLCLRAPEDIDQAMIELLGEAYAVGQQD